MNNHTPLPWKVSNKDTVVGPSGNVIAECCGYSIKATDEDQLRQGGREANAEFIALACNAHYDLLEAAKLVLAWFEAEADHAKQPDFHARIKMCGESEKAIRAAIQKVEGL